MRRKVKGGGSGVRWARVSDQACVLKDLGGGSRALVEEGTAGVRAGGQPGRREAEGTGAREDSDGLAPIVGQEIGLGYAGAVGFALYGSEGMNESWANGLDATNGANRYARNWGS